MQSSVTSEVGRKSSGFGVRGSGFGVEKSLNSQLSTGLLTLAFITLSFLSLVSRAQALSISVGTPTIVSGQDIKIWMPVAGESDNRLNVVYATADATSYTIMYASNGISGEYRLSPLSTGTIASIPVFLTAGIDSSQGTGRGLLHVYYTDASSNTIKYLVGTGLQTPQFLISNGANVNNAVTVSGIESDGQGTGALVIYSSQTSAGIFTLVAASVTYGTASDTVSSFINVVSTTQGNVASGKFAAFQNSTNGDRGILYREDNGSALKLVYINAGAVNEPTRQTLDTGSNIGDIFAIDAANITRVVYTNGGTVKYAINRRLISSQVWYIQKIDDGAATTVFSGGGTSSVSYIKSGNLWMAIGQPGTFFDDFNESISNAQRGLAGVVTGVTAGGQTNAPGTGRRPLGIFQPSGSNGLASLNMVSLNGFIAHSLNGQAIPSVRVRANLSDGGTGIVKDLNPAASSPADTAGGLTDQNGLYNILVASGSKFAVTPSSSPWKFWVSNDDAGNVQATSTNTDTLAGTNVTVNFIGVSAPTLIDVRADNGNPPALSTSNIIVVSYAEGTSENGNAHFVISSSGTMLSEKFPASGLFRFAPQSAKGTIATFTANSTGTVAEFTAANPHIPVTSFVESVNGGITKSSASAKFQSVLASTNSSLPQWYTLVYTTAVLQDKTTTFLQSSLVDAVVLRPLTIPLVQSTVTAASGSLSDSSINSSRQAVFQIIAGNIMSVSTQGLTFNRENNGGNATTDIGRSAIGTVFLTTTTSLALSPGEIGGKIPFTVITSTSSRVIVATGNIFGLSAAPTNPWFIRLSTQVNGIWHSALSVTQISFSTPTITAVRATNQPDDGSGTIFISSAEVQLSSQTLLTNATATIEINGTGLTAGTSIWITTITPAAFNIQPNGVTPPAFYAKVTNFIVNSSTWATATFVPQIAVAGSAFNPYYIYIGTSSLDFALGGGAVMAGFPVPVAGFSVSTVVANSNPVIIVSTSTTGGVTSIRLNSNNNAAVALNDSANPVLANTLSYTLLVNGFGLLNGSSITFTSVDGTAVTSPTAIAVQDANRRTATATVDFRRMQPGKFYNVVIASQVVISTPGAAAFATNIFVSTGITKADGSFTNQAIWLSSMTISTITTPGIASLANGTVFNNSTFTLRFDGAGFVSGSSITFSLGSVNFTTGPVLAPTNDGRTMQVSINGLTKTGSPPQDLGLFGAAAGIYNVSVITGTFVSAGNVPVAPNTVLSSPTATGSLSVLAPSLDSVSVSTTDAFAPIQFATYTLTGKGLLPGASIYLSTVSVTSINPSTLRTIAPSALIFGNDMSSVTAVFDQRASSNSAIYTILNVIYSTRSASDALLEPTALMLSSQTVAFTKTVSINHTSVLDAVSFRPSNVANNNLALNISGKGLALGAKVYVALVSSSTSGGGINNVGMNTPNGNTRTANLTSVNTAHTTGTVTGIDVSNAQPGTWSLTVSTELLAGPYGGPATTNLGPNNFNGGSVNNTNGGSNLVQASTYNSNSVNFTIAESFAPNAPTGLTVISAGQNTVTLSWVAPGNDGSTGNLTSGAGFIVYYSSGEDVRGAGCGACYPVAALNNPSNNFLTAGGTNFTFANTWAQFLPSSQLGSAITTTSLANAAAYGLSTTTTRGLIVNVATAALGNSAVSVGGVAGASSVSPGTTVQFTFNPNSGATKDGNFFFIVRSFDEEKNVSSDQIIYSTVSAVVTANPTNPTTALKVTEDIASGVTTISVKDKDTSGTFASDITASYTPGDSTFAGLTATIDLSPPDDTSGVVGIGPAVDIKLPNNVKSFDTTLKLAYKIDVTKITSKGLSPLKGKIGFFTDSADYQVLPVSKVDADGNTTGSTNHLTKFRTVVAVPPTNLSGLRVYPNPWRPSVGAQKAGGITFSGLPDNTTIKIYTLAGELVKQLIADGVGGIVVWNGQNEDGRDVASGVYYALLNSGGDRKTTKVAVQR